LLIERDCILLNKKGEKVPGVALWVLQKSRPEICRNSFEEDKFAKSIIFEQLAEFDVKTSMGLAIVEGDEIFA
jgi:hypothetical protein